MRCIMRRVTLSLAALMMMAVPALSDGGIADWKHEGAFEPGQQGVKDECLLVTMNCKDQVDSIHQRIDRIRGEISRGTDVYSADELRNLNRQLEEATRNLENLSMGG